MRKREAKHHEPNKYGSESSMYEEKDVSNLVHDLIKQLEKLINSVCKQGKLAIMQN